MSDRAAQHRGEEQAVRLEAGVDLRQRAGKVVDPVQRQVADDQVEAVAGEGQQLLVAGHAQTAGAARHDRRQVRLNQSLDAAAPAQAGGNLTGVATQVEGHRKSAGDVGQALGKALGDLVDEEVVGREAGGGTVPLGAHRGAIEYPRGLGHEAYMARRPGAGKGWALRLTPGWRVAFICSWARPIGFGKARRAWPAWR
jgi:hypothetical protein